MFTCTLCNRDFSRECSYTRHLNSCKNFSDKHKVILMNFRQSKVDNIFNGDVKLLSDLYVKDNKSLKFVDIYNVNCKHYSSITSVSLLNGQCCAHKDCVSLTKSNAALELSKSSIYREKLSLGVRAALKDPVKRMNRLRGQADAQRHNDSPYELLFLGILEKYNIEYVYQVPMIIKDVGCIIDFYLVKYNLYVNVNLDIFHWLHDYEVNMKLQESANEVQCKDELLREIFKEEGLLYKEVYSFDDMLSLVHRLLKGGGLDES